MERTKAGKACSTWRRRKVKCDGGCPCKECDRKNLQCDKGCFVARSTELAHTDRRTSANTANSYTYFIYRIHQKDSSLEGFGYELGDGSLIVENLKAWHVLRQVMPGFKKGQQRIAHKDLIIEILLSEERQSAKVSMLPDGHAFVTAEFFGEALEQEVRVLLRKMADGTTRELGPATWMGSTQWCTMMDYDDLVGHAVIFARRQREEAVSVPVSPGPNKLPFLGSSQPPLYELPSLPKKTPSSVPVGSTVGSPPLDSNVLFYTHQTYARGIPLQGIMISLGSNMYTSKASLALRKALFPVRESQEEQTIELGHGLLLIKPFQIDLCVEIYDGKTNLYLQANFSKVISDRSVSINAYGTDPGSFSPIHVPHRKEGCQCSIVINAPSYSGTIIVFQCDNEYIRSCPIKRPWTRECEKKLCDMLKTKTQHGDIYDSLSSYIPAYIKEELEWYEGPYGQNPNHTKRKEKVVEYIEKGRQICWLRDRQNLGEEFRGMRYSAFYVLWQNECGRRGRPVKVSYI